MTGSPQNRWRSKLAPGQNGRGARVERVCVSAYKDASCGREGQRVSREAEKPRELRREDGRPRDRARRAAGGASNAPHLSLLPTVEAIRRGACRAGGE